MITPTISQSTRFTRDTIGRYVCNGLDEALRSTDRGLHPEARPFDLIIIGGGSFGSVLASHLFFADRSRSHRILVLDGGPLVLPEHVQNLPPSLDPAGPEGIWDASVWNSDSPMAWNRQFPGLAFCLGGRSLFWGGWSPYFIDSEVDASRWPPSVKQDLMTPVLNLNGHAMSYLDRAAQQIGTDATNDFLFGPLHVGLRKQLFDGLKNPASNGGVKLTGNRGSLNAVGDLEAPLAVQSASPRPGFFPLNKFNGVQLLIRAARAAQAEAQNSAVGDVEAIAVKKRLMVCANTKVVRLERAGRRITRIITNEYGEEIPIDVAENAKVFLALGTIENTRQALLALPNAKGFIGQNLMAHLRSNLTVRLSRTDFRKLLDNLKRQDPANFPSELEQSLKANELGTSALFVKGITKVRPDLTGHFHIQITASGVGGLSAESEAELFKKLPSLDELDRIALADDQWIVITLRGIGEMFGTRVPVSPLNRVALDPLGPRGYFDYGQPRALVSLESGAPGSEHAKLWDAMDAAALKLAKIFGSAGQVQYLHPNRDPKKAFWADTPPGPDLLRDTLTTTHHEAGTLWMGTSPDNSVTDEWGQFWESSNLYAVGPAVLPTMGSPNPMLSGVALALRLGDHLLTEPPASANEPRAPFEGAPLDETSFRALFDGTDKTFGKWITVGGSAFALVDGMLVAQPGGGLGLLFHAAENFNDFTLRLEFKLNQPLGDGNDNSGVFIRFRDPRRPVPRRDGSGEDTYSDAPFVAVDTGFEVQIDEEARGNRTLGEPDGMDKKRTGALYDIPTQSGNGFHQDYQRGRPIDAGVWNTMEIRVAGQNYQVFLNGKRTTSYGNSDGYRGKPRGVDPHSGYIGLQAHTGQVAFRNVRIKA